VLCDDAVLEPRHLEIDVRTTGAPAPEASAQSLHDEVKSLERERIERALRDCSGNQSRAAELLGISRGALLRRLEQLGIARSRKEA
jgi:DNA-binding NtrC family response regulator